MRLEHSRRGIAVGAALVASLACASPALAGPIAKARYDGRDANHKRALVVVSKDGRSVKQFGFATRTKCSDGKRHAVVFVSDKKTHPAILPDSSFNHHEVVGRDRADVSGQFDQGGNTLTGIYSVTLHGRGYTCRTGDVTYTLHRDGTPGAPFRDPLTASGLYTASAKDLKLQLRPLVPGGFIHSFRAAYLTSCSGAKKRRSWAILASGVAIRRGRFGAAVRGRQRLKSGGAAITRAVFTGLFTYAGGYKFAGKLSARNVIRKPGRPAVVCRATIPFTGRFVRGPLGEEGPHPAM
jgi:hypothetical protein